MRKEEESLNTRKKKEQLCYFPLRIPVNVQHAIFYFFFFFEGERGEGGDAMAAMRPCEMRYQTRLVKIAKEYFFPLQIVIVRGDLL